MRMNFERVHNHATDDYKYVDNRSGDLPEFPQNRVKSIHRPVSVFWSKLSATKRIIFLFVIVGAFLIHTFHLNVVAEDAFITFQFARHLANGHGIVWNIGEAPVEGYTNFLWLLLSASLIRGGLDVTCFTQLVGVFASLVTMIYTYRFGKKLFNLPTSYALIPCLFLAVSGPFAAWASSGMETNLFGMFLLAGCYYFVSSVQFDTHHDLVLCFLMLLFATLTRPEGFMVYGLLTALGALFSLGQPRAVWMRFILAFSVYTIPFLVYFFWRYSYFGFWLPNTFYAKTGGGFSQYLRGVKYSGLFAFHFLLPLLPIFFIFVWVHGFGRATQTNRGQNILKHLRNHINVYICILVSAVYTMYIVYAGGDYMAMYRFFVPILPFFYLLLGPAIYYLLKSVAGTRYKEMLTVGIMSFAIVMTFLQSTPIESRLFHKPEFMHGTYQGIQYERWHVARYKVIADFFKEYRRSEQESLALGPIGVISYYSDMTIYSVFGIVDPYIAHKQMAGISQVLAGHEKHDLSYILSKRPTYFLFSLSLLPVAESVPDYSGEVRNIIEENYQLKSVWLEDRINSEAGYFTFLELKTREP